MSNSPEFSSLRLLDFETNCLTKNVDFLGSRKIQETKKEFKIEIENSLCFRSIFTEKGRFVILRNMPR